MRRRSCSGQERPRSDSMSEVDWNRSVVRSGWSVGVRAVGPSRRVVCHPRSTEASARAIPSRPEERFPRNRTASRGSWVGPAVIRTRGGVFPGVGRGSFDSAGVLPIIELHSWGGVASGCTADHTTKLADISPMSSAMMRAFSREVRDGDCFGSEGTQEAW